ncbi:MAG: HlyC/CorC family transporter [Alphaproteobacteria bacterium]|nr:HlyC/CorC family transporter [Alphaproteobacteria bacterium]
MDESILFIYIVSIVFCVFASGFFSAAETGVIASSRARIYQLKERGDKRAALVSHLLDRKDELISAILLGNNAINIACSSISTTAAIHYFGDIGALYASLGLTLIIIIFSEIIPKTYAVYHAEKVALAVAPSLKVTVFILAPILKSIEILVNWIMKNIGFRRKEGLDRNAVNEIIRGTIAMHHQEGAMLKEDRDMLSSILDLAHREVSEIMTHRTHVSSLNIDMNPLELTSLVLDNQHTRIPLWKDNPDNIIGILHARDLLKALKTHERPIEELSVTDIASPPWFIPESTLLHDQLKAFRARRSHFAVVVDEYGSVQGIVTLEDILEEIVGNIDDEHDTVREDIVPLPDKGYRIAGHVTIRDLNRKLEWDLPDDHAATISGLVLHEVGELPEEKQSFRFYGYRFEIVKRGDKKIKWLKIERLPHEGNDSQGE